MAARRGPRVTSRGGVGRDRVGRSQANGINPPEAPVRRPFLALIVVGTLLVGPSAAHPATPVASPTNAPAVPTATGSGGAIATVDATATGVGLAVLRSGGNAIDAAVAAAATLGVTEPLSAGIGGGGFLVFYDARTGRVSTIDGREAAPA